MTEGHVAACFIRVDVRVDGAATQEAYDALSERLQDSLQEAILAPADDDDAIDLQGMTCLVLGPIPDDETMENVLEHEENFAPIAECGRGQPSGGGRCRAEQEVVFRVERGVAIAAGRLREARPLGSC